MSLTSYSDMTGPDWSPEHVLQLEEFRKLTRDHLENFPALFTRLTGLESTIAWAPTSPHRWGEHDLPTHSRVCRQITAASSAALTRCRSCGLRHLDLTLKAGQQGHHFLCDYGVRNFWFPITIRHCTVGIAFVQALRGTAAKGPAGPRATSASRPRRAAAKAMTASDFKQDARLLKLILQHAQTSALADLRKQDLSQAQRALLELQTVTTRLREELNGMVPAFNKAAPALQPENHVKRTVHAAMDYIHQNYARPMTLQGCADALHLNAAYLSSLFTRAVGLSFKTYLTDVRMEQARLLLNDPARNIADVASAVGYASENRFRSAFKKVTGLCPRSWRETLRATLPCLLGWLLQAQECLTIADATCLF